jgi:hypothetical protein
MEAVYGPSGRHRRRRLRLAEVFADRVSKTIGQFMSLATEGRFMAQMRAEPKPQIAPPQTGERHGWSDPKPLLNGWNPFRVIVSDADYRADAAAEVASRPNAWFPMMSYGQRQHKRQTFMRAALLFIRPTCGAPA